MLKDISLKLLESSKSIYSQRALSHWYTCLHPAANVALQDFEGV
jgi:hypothetical protein